MNTKKQEVSIVIVICSIFFIISIIIFFAGVCFENWGGFDKSAPIVINLIRKNILGDKTVLNIEKRYFSFNDFLKQKYKNGIDKTDDKIDYKLNEQVINLTQDYFKDYTKFKTSDYNALSIFLQNSYPNIDPIYQKFIKSEGVWKKFFISPETFRPLYAKTFLRTDHRRGYAKVYIYKFDMDRLRLEFIPGKDDSDDEKCSGRMSKEQRKRVLWIFSGGYQYIHGKYGMKYKDKIILPPNPGAATLLFYRDGTYKIIEWQKDMTDDTNAFAFRQNEIPLITNGKTNHSIKKFWGFTPKDVNPIYTVRSGLGFTKNGELVFAFGEDLSAKSLAIGMIKAGVITGMHLDMNYYNVHFVNVERTKNRRLKTYNENEILSYYKNIYSVYSNRDYFILTEKD